jgi:apolipoprotein N-acyltransferase
VETVAHPPPGTRHPSPGAKSGVPLALAALSGLLLILSFPSADLGWLAWVALVPLLAAIRRSSLRGAAALGWVTGAIWFGGILAWLRLFGEPPFNTILWMLAVSVEAIAVGLFALLGRWLWVGRRAPLLVVPALWTLTEWLRCTGPWGFPWGVLGETQARWSTLIQCADLGGVWLVSFLVAWGNAVVVGLPLLAPPPHGGRGEETTAVRNSPFRGGEEGRGIRWFALALAVTLLYGLLPRPDPSGPSIRVSLVQADNDFGEYLALTRQAFGERPDLVVWPETVVPGDPVENPAIRNVLAELAREGDMVLLAGAPHEDAEGRLKNAAVLVGPSGERTSAYSKVHLVPFGEYIPFRPWVPFLDRFPSVTDMHPGAEYHALGAEAGRIPRLGTMICFESAFPEIGRAFVRDGAGLLVVLTSDASYDRTSAPEHHARMAIFRAVETRRAVLQAATTGATFAVDARGRALGRLPMHRPGVLTLTVTPGTATTLYTRLGNWVMVGCAVFVVALAARRRSPDG